MKKIFSILLLFFLAVSILFALPGSTQALERGKWTDKEITDAEKKKNRPFSASPENIDILKVGILMPSKSLQRWFQDGEYLKEKLEEKGFKPELKYANHDASLQISQIEKMISEGCGILVITAIDSSSLKRVLKEAGEAGVTVIAYDRLIIDTPDVDYYATFDGYYTGQLQGLYIIEKLGLDKGAGPFNIEVFGGSPADSNAFIFNSGAMDELQPYIDSGQLEVVSGQTDMSVISIYNWDPYAAKDRMNSLLTEYYTDRVIDAVLSPNDSLAQGIVSSLKDNGYGSPEKPFPVLTGQDCDSINVRMILNREQSMSVLKDTMVLADRVITMITEISEGKAVTVNDTEKTDNNMKIVPAYLCKGIVIEAHNYIRIFEGHIWYTEEDLYW